MGFQTLIYQHHPTVLTVSDRSSSAHGSMICIVLLWLHTLLSSNTTHLSAQQLIGVCNWRGEMSTTSYWSALIWIIIPNSCNTRLEQWSSSRLLRDVGSQWDPRSMYRGIHTSWIIQVIRNMAIKRQQLRVSVVRMTPGIRLTDQRPIWFCHWSQSETPIGRAWFAY